MPASLADCSHLRFAATLADGSLLIDQSINFPRAGPKRSSSFPPRLLQSVTPRAWLSGTAPPSPSAVQPLQASTGRGYAAIMRTRRRRRRPTGARSSGGASRGRGGQEIASHRSETARRLRVAFHPEERRGGASLDAVGERRAAHRCHGGRIGEGAVASAQLLSFLRCAPPRNRTPLKAQKPLGMGATPSGAATPSGWTEWRRRVTRRRRPICAR